MISIRLNGYGCGITVHFHLCTGRLWLSLQPILGLLIIIEDTLKMHFYRLGNTNVAGWVANVAGWVANVVIQSIFGLWTTMAKVVRRCCEVYRAILSSFRAKLVELCHQPFPPLLLFPLSISLYNRGL